ncbi:MAG: energy transducer TonB [Lacibacter sp.]|nr:energy transducer TonB [Lacibacter sp.]
MKKTILVILILITRHITHAQTDTISFYIDGSEKKVEQKNATFLRLGIREETYWRVYDLYLTGDKIRMKGYCKDDSLKLKEGPCDYYYKSGKLFARRYYMNGKQHGLDKSWYETGRLQDSAMYKNGVVIGEEKGWYEDGKLRFIISYDTSGNGNGSSQNFYQNGVIRNKGNYKNEKRNGGWLYYREDNSPASEVTFEKDSVITYKAFDEKGKLLNKVKDFEREANYKGGEEAWNKYMSKSLGSISEMPDLREYSGSCTIQFIIDKDGNVTDVEAIESTSEKLSQLAIALIIKSKKWVPAIQYNLPVKAWRRQKFTFKI